MALKGKQVYGTLNGKLDEVERQFSELSSHIARNESRIGELTGDREGVYVSLAQLYLPELTDHVRTELAEKQEAVARAVRQRRNQHESLERLVSQNRERRSQKQQTLDSIDEQMNAAGDMIRTKHAAVAQELENSADYQSLKKKIAEAQRKLEEDRKQLGAVRKSVPAKINAYEADVLFKYLLERGYGTEEYVGSFLTRTLDAWAARKVNFDEQKREYYLLKMLPAAIDERLSLEEAAGSELQGTKALLEDSVDRKHGLSDAIQSGKDLDTKRNGILDSVDKLDKEYDGLQEALRDANSTKGSHYRQAVDELKGYLAGQTLQDLRARATETATAADDRLVDKLEEIDREIKELKRETKKVRKEQETVGSQLSGLRDIERHYTRHDYESSKSRFDNSFDMNALLMGYLLGNLTANDVNRSVEQSQHFEHTSQSSSSHYSSSSSSGSDYSSGGDFGGGGFSSGGGFDSGGGGFSTGGGF
ncbi:hypothetical protein HY772_01815 [Candidatus Woesearchaeota archaeon]|nr:hypothetical protein [Candidatus Woesearchaeota archaeon]